MEEVTHGIASTVFYSSIKQGGLTNRVFDLEWTLLQSLHRLTEKLKVSERRCYAVFFFSD